MRYLGRHGSTRVAMAVLIGAIPPVMVKSDKNPGGTSIEEFDKIRAAVVADRSQFWKDLSMLFYGYNRPGAKVSEGVRAARALHNAQECNQRGAVRFLQKRTSCEGVKFVPDKAVLIGAIPSRRKQSRKGIMENIKLLLVSLCFMTGTAMAQEPTATPLVSRDLADTPGKEAVMITVEYAPGGSDPIHRHNAQAFVYVLEGSIVMELKGGKQVTLKPGPTFYEGPDDIHLVGRNTNSTEPAKFLVFLVKDKSVPILIPVK